ncbi:FAD-binding oxidoreductase [Novosphingobium profundi]|uniref:FAD-binding oxidoreductase n=1 Tax=Novosphingobium profundi TaxID=1774954 RepID=UPI001BD9F2ED|nr:FAD-binding oxidoreductase [Novosphingobium profundi]
MAIHDRREAVKLLAGSAVALSTGMAGGCRSSASPANAEQKADFAKALTGKAVWKGDADYEIARAAAAYKVNLPERYPALIVLAESERDVVGAVRFAREHGHKVTVRSGGHSWSSAHIRDDVVMIDMSRLQTVEIDAEARTLWTNPGVLGSEINMQLEPHGLLVPTAHHPSPGIGGFCMNGGFGWNSRVWGNGCHHVLAIDVVTPDGDLIRADADQNSDYWWAARGGGAGFFGVITRMQLQCRKVPLFMKVSAYGFGAEAYEDLIRWARGNVENTPRNMEMVITSTSHDRITGERIPVRFTLAALAMGDDEAQVDAALDSLRTMPRIEEATFAVEKKPTTLEERYASGYDADPAGFRYAADNIYTEASADDLVERLRPVFLEQPSPRTHTFWLTWGPTRPLPEDAAFSMQGDVYVATYTLWEDPAEDERLSIWPAQQMRALSDIAIGGQMNDENMLQHRQKYLSEEAYARFEKLRLKHDPEGIFAGWLGSPMPAAG